MISRGDKLEFAGKDSYYKGVVVSVFQKKSGAVRCVVEDDRGLLLIKNPDQGVKVDDYT